MTRVSTTLVVDLEDGSASIRIEGAGEPRPTKSLVDALEEFMRDQVGPILLEHMGLPKDTRLEENCNTDWQEFRANVAKFENGLIQDIGLDQWWVILDENGTIMPTRATGNEIQSVLAAAATESIRNGRTYHVAKVFGTVSQNQNGTILWR